MSNKTRHTKTSTQTQDEALKVAKATQRPGQAKEQTKLIAQGIEKGIYHYKKQQKAKVRIINKKKHKTGKNNDDQFQTNQHSSEVNPNCMRSSLPWILLIISWIGFFIHYSKDLW